MFVVVIITFCSQQSANENIGIQIRDVIRLLPKNCRGEGGSKEKKELSEIVPRSDKYNEHQSFLHAQVMPADMTEKELGTEKNNKNEPVLNLGC